MTEEARKWHHLFSGGHLGEPETPAVIETYHEPTFYSTEQLNPIPGVGQFWYITSYDEKPDEETVKADFEAWVERRKSSDAGE